MNKPRLNYLRLICLLIFAFTSCTIYAQIEICDDNIDNDGDGAIDEFDFDCNCVNPNLAYYGSTNGDIYTVDLLTNGSEQLITNSPFLSSRPSSRMTNAIARCDCGLRKPSARQVDSRRPSSTTNN